MYNIGLYWILGVTVVQNNKKIEYKLHCETVIAPLSVTLDNVNIKIKYKYKYLVKVWVQ